MTAAAWTLEVRGHELARNPKDGAQFAVFCVQVTTPEGPYTVKRRFQAFWELHKQVREFALAKHGRAGGAPHVFVGLHCSLQPFRLALRFWFFDIFCNVLVVYWAQATDCRRNGTLRAIF